MNKNKIILTVSILLLLILGLVITLKSLKDNNGKTNSDIEIVQNEIVKEETKNYEIKDLGTIECEKIDLNAPIKETTELDVLETAVGHFEDTAIYNVNVCLAGHNSGTNKNGEDIGFFKRLNELTVGDEVLYNHSFGTYIYKVSEIKEIEETDFSVLEPTTNDKLTLITCIKGQKKLRLCVICDRI
jgi:sortase A